MADPPASSGGGAQGKKILGMPRTTAFIVIGIGAVVVGYFLISHFSGSKQGQGQGGGGQGPSAPAWQGGGNRGFVTVIREWQGHQHRHGGGGVNPGGPRQ